MMPFQYAVIRAVPQVERGEMINIGVVVYCQQADFLAAAIEVDDDRLLGLSVSADPAAVRESGEAIVSACVAPVGSARENAGLGTRFGMITAPRSTVVQPGPVHAGVTEDPQATLHRLMERLVRVRPAGGDPRPG